MHRSGQSASSPVSKTAVLKPFFEILSAKWEEKDLEDEADEEGDGESQAPSVAEDGYDPAVADSEPASVEVASETPTASSGASGAKVKAAFEPTSSKMVDVMARREAIRPLACFSFL